MRLRRTRATGSLSNMLGELFGTRAQRRPRQVSSIAGVERFEERKMLALTIDTISTPAVGSTDVDMATDLVLSFNESVVKGQGNIYVVEQTNGEAGVWVDVRDAAVTVNGADVSIDLPVDLLPDNTYSIHIDPGAFIDTSTTPTAGATLLTQNFEFVNLEPFINETEGDGTDFSTTAQFGFEFETPLDPTKGIDEWRGWSYAGVNSWLAADNQSRDQFTLGDGTVMIADSDEYDDGNAAERPWLGYSYTPEIDLAGVAADSVKIEFDSSFRPESTPANSGQTGTFEVTFDGGATWTELLRLDGTNTSNSGSNAVSANINERLVSGTSTGASTDGLGNIPFAAVSNPDSGTMQFRWFKEGSNDWWWAIDDVVVTGDIVGVPYEGLTDATVWTFSTPESPRLSISIDSAAMSENGGTATATLTRNSGPLVPSGELVVSLASSDESELTVPATVTIPDGELSVTFPITAVDDAEIDRTQEVTITASVDPFTAGTGTILVLDDEGPKIVSVTPDYSGTDVDYQTSLTVEFDKEVVKGAGIIRVVYAESGEQVAEIDVASTDVTVSGTTMTVVLPDLPGFTEYNVLMDDGVVISTGTALFSGVVLMQENFDALPLLDFADSLVGSGVGDGTDYTFQNPLGFSVDNSQMPPGGSSPFEGWSYMDKNSWIAEQGNQSRSQFARGTGTVAVADGDAWDDYPHEPDLYMNTFLITRPVDLAGITPGSVTLEFDSSFYHELPQFGTVEVSYDGGSTWGPLLFFGDEFVPGIADGSSRNDRIVVGSSSQSNDIIGGAIVDAPLNTPSTGTLQFRFGYQNAGNNWWWAVDNIVVRGERAGEPFAGLAGDAWSFTTGEAPTLAVTFDANPIPETVASFADDFTTSASAEWGFVEVNASLAAGDVAFTNINVVNDELVLAGDPAALANGDYAVYIAGFANSADVASATDVAVRATLGSLANATTVGGATALGNNDAYVLARFNAVSGSGYAAVLDMSTGQFGINSVVELGETSLASGTVPGFDPTARYDVELRAVGSELTASVYAVGGDAPLVTVSAVDAGFASGATGFAAQINTDVDFANATLIGLTVDNFAATSLVPSSFGTVTRNLELASELVVTLTSSDETAAVVPATVTIPAGEASVTFPIYAVDDTVTDGNQVTVITASGAGFFTGESSLIVTDDDFPQLISATPVGGVDAAAVDGALTLVFDQNVIKGNGFISIIEASTGVAVESIDVQSTAVAVADATVTLTRSVRLVGLSDYYVRIDQGAFLAEAAGTTDAIPMLLQDFERLSLGPAVDEDPAEGDGSDWTATPPSGWAVDNTNNATGGVTEYRGWTFLDKDVWNAWSGQGRDAFTLGSGTVAVADTDEFDDLPDGRPMDTLLVTPALSLAAVAGTQVAIEFDSSFRPEGGGGGFAEGNQAGVVEVTFDGGENWTNLLTLDGDNSTGSIDDPSVNRREQLVADIPDGATTMQVRWGQQGTNDYWWAIDNVNINATMVSPSFPGVTDTTTIAFTTEDAAAQPVLEGSTVVGGTSSTDVSAPITLTFNQPMRAGNGFLHIVDTVSGFAVESFNVNDDVTFTGRDVVITPASRLGFETAYHLQVDQGALLTAASENRVGVPLLLQDFELLPLGPAVDEAPGDGTDWTATPPTDWTVDNTNNATGGVTEYRGWTFIDKEQWNTWSGQGRDSFTLGSGTVAVADTDEFDDIANGRPMDTLLLTPVIDLETVNSSDVTIEFDSSFRPEGGGGGFADGNQAGVVEVTFDDGVTWTNLLTLDGNNSTGDITDPSVNRHEVLTATIPAGATAMQVRWGQQGTNDYWWAIDNVSIKGDIDRWSFEGIADDTTVAFTTMADIIPDLSAAAPADGSATFAVDGDITLTFDTAVKVGNGYVHIVDAATGAAVESISVRSAAVTVNDQTVTINPAGDLTADTAYELRVDRGAFLGTTAITRANVPLLLQDFELLPLGPAVDEAAGDGTDWTATPPTDWSVDNTNNATGGVTEYRGWTFIDKEQWNTWSGQGRDAFTLGSGTVAVADTDEFDDLANGRPMDTLMVTPVIDLASVASDVTIEFDSSFRPEGGGGGFADGNQTGVVEVTFDGGSSWTNLLTLDGDTSDGSLSDPSVNRHEMLTAAVPAGATEMQVRWGQQGTNDYWWAIDNVAITATVDGYEFAGLGAEELGFTTAPASNDVVTDVGDGQTVTDTTVYTGDQTIVKTGAGTLILNLANSHSGGLRVEGGTVIIQNVDALNGGPLTIGAGAKAKLDVGSSLVALSSLTMDGTGLLDVGTGGFTVAGGGFSAADTRAALISGRNGGTWDGTSGIMFSAVSAAAPATAFGVGYGVSGDGLMTVRYTADGDAQMDGKVDFDDILALFPNYDGDGTYVWADGDFTYDGKVDFDDILALFPNYGSDAVFGAGLLGQGGGSGSGAGDAGTGGSASSQSADSNGDGATEQQPVMGPEAPADLPTRTTTTLLRSSSIGGQSDATSLAFAALAIDGQTESASGDKKKSVFATL